MRVAVNAEQLLYRSPGGIGRYTAQLLTVLPATFADVEVVPLVALHRPSEARSVLAGAGVGPAVLDRLAIQPLPRPALYEAWLRVGRPRPRFPGRAALVHAPSAAVPPSAGCPLVVSIHDAAPELFPDAFSARSRRFHRLGMEAAAARADVVITGSQAAADEIVGHSTIPADRIRVVPHGVDPPAGDPAADRRTLAPWGLDGPPYVLWVGSLEPRKGVGTLLAAMTELRRRGAHPEVHTVLAGFEGWRQEGLITASDRDLLGPALHQVGRVTEGELWALYRQATVFAFPSRHEGFGLPVVEAMSQGVPVVASDIPVLREVAGGAAVLVEPDQPGRWADAIDGLLGDEAARSGLARAGRERSRSYTVAAMVTSTRRVYQTVGS